MIWFRDYFAPWSFTIVLHLTLVVMAGWGWQQSPADPYKQAVPKHVKAKLVKLEEQKPKAKAKPKPQKNPPKKDDSKKKTLEIKRKKAAEKKKIQEKKLAIKRKKEKEEKQRKERENKRKQEKEKQEQRERELAAEQEQKEEDERKRDEAEASLAMALEDEEEFISTVSDQELVQSYTGFIDKAIQRNWSRPPSARNNMVVVLRIQLIPTGRVVNVDVIESSGNDAFDRQAVVAVQKTGQFPELMELPGRVFEANFRSLKLRFKPEDLNR